MSRETRAYGFRQIPPPSRTDDPSSRSCRARRRQCAVSSVKDSILSLAHAASLNPMQPSSWDAHSTSYPAGQRVCSEQFARAAGRCHVMPYSGWVQRTTRVRGRYAPRVRIRQCHSLLRDDKGSSIISRRCATSYCCRASDLPAPSHLPCAGRCISSSRGRLLIAALSQRTQHSPPHDDELPHQWQQQQDETRPDRPPERHGICLSCPRLSVGIFH